MDADLTLRLQRALEESALAAKDRDAERQMRCDAAQLIDRLKAHASTLEAEKQELERKLNAAQELAFRAKLADEL
eukprot:3904-Eustigmatos_ZCMA.PRE.1